MLVSGSKVVYPGQGPCVVNEIVKMTLGSGSASFYRLQVLERDGGTLLVPVDKADSIGLRPLLRKADIAKLLSHLGERAVKYDDYRQRAKDHSRLLNSGSPFDLAQIVESLTGLTSTKSLSINERKTLERAKRLLVSEISEVTGQTREEAERQVDSALGLVNQLESGASC
ncbi:MAG TPA: CarD family transcriptional regulator [Blastocatellia bacterium]|nr:CarD family transcriptional regulator [Blastocatellia bacterium]